MIELVGGSPSSWSGAVENAVKEATKTAKDIRRVYAKSLMCNVRNGKIIEYRAQVRITVPT